MASPAPVAGRNEALRHMQGAAEEAAGALGEICSVLNEIALDMSFARHASRMPLRVSSERIENVSRTLIGEVNACGPIGAKHASIIGKVVLAAATMPILPFAEDAGHVTMHRFKAAHERGMRNLESVRHHAELVQSETRRDLSLQITALVGELDDLAAHVGVEMADQRRELDEAMDMRQLPAKWALEGVDQIFCRARMNAQWVSEDDGDAPLPDPSGNHLHRLAEIEFLIADIFAQLTGDEA